MFVAQEVCCIMTFVTNYDICRLYGLSQYPETLLLYYNKVLTKMASFHFKSLLIQYQYCYLTYSNFVK